MLLSESENNMKIAISGSTGFIGTHLIHYLSERGYQVVPIGRELLSENAFQRLIKALNGCSVVINLAGAPINRRWTKAYKKELYDSRIKVTRLLVHAISESEHKPEVLLSASAVGYYPSEGEYDEDDVIEAEGFLAALCREWEAEARKSVSYTRVVITRFGLVLSPDGGALSQMLLPLRWLRFSSVIGNGYQSFPWIGITDLCRAVGYLLEDKKAAGVYNLTSPQSITQRYFARVLAKAYHAWGIQPIPGFIFQLLYGEGSKVVTEGQNVHPRRLLDAGFTYLTPTIECFLQFSKDAAPYRYVRWGER